MTEKSGLGVDREGSTTSSQARTEYPAASPPWPPMTIYYHGTSVTLSESEVFDFSVTLGVAKRSRENVDGSAECVKRSRKIWTRLGVWGTPSDD